MRDTAQIWLPDAVSTHSCGRRLAETLYDLPVTILLRGELGAGKTTFVQGLGLGLGIGENMMSPTFALEQRYILNSEFIIQSSEFIHIDLYRLSERQAEELLLATEEFQGIRCIEWPERANCPWDKSAILIRLEEENAGRRCIVEFDDADAPTRGTIEQWRRRFALPPHIADHCDSVADFAEALGKRLLGQGIPLRPLLLRRSAEVHDLFRFLDFHPGGHANGNIATPEELAVWGATRVRYPGLRHEPACAKFLGENGFHALAAIVAVHGLTLPSPQRRTIEQQLLFYADKRVQMTDVVSLDERFTDFQKRYGNGKETEESKIWYAEASAVEKGLFPGGCPL